MLIYVTIYFHCCLLFHHVNIPESISSLVNGHVPVFQFFVIPINAEVKILAISLCMCVRILKGMHLRKEFLGYKVRY